MPLFIEKSKSGVLPITHKEMTRFSISMNEAIEMLMYSIKALDNGQILIPKIPSYKVTDLASIFSKCKIKIIGIRTGEKLHEDLISSAESSYAVETKKYYILFPNTDKKKMIQLQKKIKAKKVSVGLIYNSKTNKIFLNKKQLVQIIDAIKKKID